MLTTLQSSKDVPYESCPGLYRQEYPWHAFGEDQCAVTHHTTRGQEKSRVGDGIPSIYTDLLLIPYLTGYR